MRSWDSGSDSKTAYGVGEIDWLLGSGRFLKVDRWLACV